MDVQANELRIGNLILMPFLGNVIIEVTGIALADRYGEYKLFIQSKDKSGSIFFELPDKYAPIPLTEEWLVKFGFEKGTDLFEEYAEYEKQFDKGKSITISHKFECYQGIYSQEIKSVHQLQNLYFALTGEELTIKDK